MFQMIVPKIVLVLGVVKLIKMNVAFVMMMQAMTVFKIVKVYGAEILLKMSVEYVMVMEALVTLQ